MARPVEVEYSYARELGLDKKQLTRLGGRNRVQRMSPDARTFLVDMAKARRKGSGESVRESERGAA